MPPAALFRGVIAHVSVTLNDGVDAGLLCHLLFGVRDDPTYGPAMVRFRCGPSGLGSSRGYCHKLNMPHYCGLRDVAV